MVRLSGPPQAPALVNHSNHTQTVHIPQKRPFHKESLSMALATLVPPSGRKSSANAHTVKLKKIIVSQTTNAAPSEARVINKQIQTRRKAYPHKQKLLASLGASNTNSAVPFRGTRNERAEASPNGGPLTRLVVIIFHALWTFNRLLNLHAPTRSPAGSGPLSVTA